ncbi:LLM class F420-dependent oxidoreductase [Nocardia sp. NPDC020380]|uniref:LLM class F420-dependent oxidoreductase n=1 Tax=Nocardia sp. NPDC020380 TaxID=3364309 RepID=UPI0037AA6A19
MDFGIHFIDFLPGDATALGPTLARTAVAAEGAGASMFTLADHLFQMEAVGRAGDPFLEGYTSLGFLAGQTETITLTMLVTGVTYRYPGVLAKIVSTLDVLSQGRSMLGLGAAWYEREHLALGVPYPALRDRFEMLEETLRICLQMWSADDGTFEGKHYQLAETICEPQPIRRPPILLGGSGEKKTLRMVAQYADVWNTTTPLDELPHKLEVLRRHCADVGRDPAEILCSAGLFADPFADTDGYLKTVERYAELGFGLLNVGPVPGNPDPAGWVERYGEQIAPRLAEIG